MAPNAFTTIPLKTVDPLPASIDPCPISEAAFEIRFSTDLPGSLIAGKLHTELASRYPTSKPLPQFEGLPEEIRKLIPSVPFLPHSQLIGKDAIVQIGPAVLGLLTHSQRYPGWRKIREELEFLLTAARRIGLMKEGIRLGVRYTNFFAGMDVFDKIHLDIKIDNHSVAGVEREVKSVFKEGQNHVRLNVTNAAIMGIPVSRHKGSVIDIDTWLNASDFSVADDATLLNHLAACHDFEKRVFFGLLTDDFLRTLKPTYDGPIANKTL